MCLVLPGYLLLVSNKRFWSLTNYYKQIIILGLFLITSVTLVTCLNPSTSQCLYLQNEEKKRRWAGHIPPLPLLTLLADISNQTGEPFLLNPHTTSETFPSQPCPCMRFPLFSFLLSFKYHFKYSYDSCNHDQLCGILQQLPSHSATITPFTDKPNEGPEFVCHNQ